MDSSNSSTSSNRDMYLNQLNKNSHKISKPIRKPLPPPPPPPSSSSSSAADSNQQNLGQNQAQSQQPPVYNINKNDFRDVVQKLTGSPAHERFPAQPPPAAQPRPPSSRLQRIRPPPLAQINNRPQLNQVFPLPAVGSTQPFTPLPPLPSVHTAAESPISAYMRFLQTSGNGSSSAPPPLWIDVGEQAAQASSPISAYMKFLQNSVYASSAASPRWNSVTQPPPPHLLPTQQQPTLPFPMMPMSPLLFGCALSPRSPYRMMSPSLMFSPTGQFGLPQLPLSPTVPVQSPKWKNR